MFEVLKIDFSHGNKITSFQRENSILLDRARMNDFAISNGITPTIALLTSDGVEEVSRRNQLSFGDLLIPFSTVQTSISVILIV